jgi:hypothetical protein
MATSIIVKTKLAGGVLYYLNEEAQAALLARREAGEEIGKAERERCWIEFGRVELVQVVDQPVDPLLESKVVRESYVATTAEAVAISVAFDSEKDARDMLYHRLMEAIAAQRN